MTRRRAAESKERRARHRDPALSRNADGSAQRQALEVVGQLLLLRLALAAEGSGVGLELLDLRLLLVELAQQARAVFGLLAGGLEVLAQALLLGGDAVDLLIHLLGAGLR